jgi:predicted restriction endonuclease
MVRKAARTVHPKDKPMTQAAAVRRVLPWSLIASHLNNPPTRFGQKEHATITYGDVVPDLEDIYRSGKKETTKRALIEARLGQGQFRVRVGRRWNDQCAVTGCAISSVLRASHIKPWSKSSDRERLDPANGILLAAHVDALFDCGLISFADNGKMLVSEQVRNDLNQLQLPDRLRRKPMKAEKLFLAYHRRHVLVA